MLETNDFKLHIKFDNDGFDPDEQSFGGYLIRLNKGIIEIKENKLTWKN